MKHLKNFNSPKTVSLFTFSSIPGRLGDHIFKLAIELCGDGSLDYSAFKYRVGSFSNEYDKAHKNDKDKYDQDEVNLDREIVKWFIDQGIKPGESVYIER